MVFGCPFSRLLVVYDWFDSRNFSRAKRVQNVVSFAHIDYFTPQTSSACLLVNEINRWCRGRETRSIVKNIYALSLSLYIYIYPQKDRDLLRATAVTWGWSGYRNKIQHTKIKKGWPWRRKISHRSCQGLNQRAFDHDSGALPLSYPRCPVTAS